MCSCYAIKQLLELPLMYIASADLFTSLFDLACPLYVKAEGECSFSLPFVSQFTF